MSSYNHQQSRDGFPNKFSNQSPDKVSENHLIVSPPPKDDEFAENQRNTRGSHHR